MYFIAITYDAAPLYCGFTDFGQAIQNTRYSQAGTWWDKKPDGDKHTEIFPIGKDIMGVNPQLVQNPRY